MIMKLKVKMLISSILSAMILAVLIQRAAADTTIAAYSFDDGTATDNSGQDLDGTIFGVTAGEGMFGGGLVFAGNDSSYVTIPNLGTHDEVTVAAWFKVTGRVGQWRVLYNVDNWNAGWLHHQLYPDNRLGFSIHSNAGGNDRHSNSIFDATSINVWHHSAAVYSSIDGTLKLYIDGVIDVEHSWGGNPIVLDAGRLGGWNSGGRAFQGTIDEVIFLDYAASPQQVIDLMSQGIGETRIFQITDIALVPDNDSENNEIVFQWTATEGKNYAVDRNLGLDGEWIELDDGVISTGKIMEYRDTSLPSPLPDRLFYRVRELQ